MKILFMVSLLVLDVHLLNLTVFQNLLRFFFLLFSLDILVMFCMCKREMLTQITERQRPEQDDNGSVAGGSWSHSNKSKRNWTILESDEAPVKFSARKLQKMFIFFYTDKKIPNELGLITNYKKFLKLNILLTCLLLISVISWEFD